MGSGHMPKKSQGHIQLLGGNSGVLFLSLTLVVGELLQEGEPLPALEPTLTSELMFKLRDPISL